MFPDASTTDSTIAQEMAKTILSHCATNGKNSETNIENTNQLIWNSARQLRNKDLTDS